MRKKLEIHRPDEGVDTLVTQFSLGRLDQVVLSTRKKFGADATPVDVATYLEEAYPELADHMISKLTVLVSGEIPSDDFGEADLASIEQPDDRTAHIEMKGEFARDAGDLVFFGSVRWVIASRNDQHLVLKRF